MCVFRTDRCAAVLNFAATLTFASINLLAATTNDRWTNDLGGFWHVASNWSSNRPPDTSFSLVTITNIGTKTVVIDSGTAAANLVVQRVTISSPAGTNTLQLVDLSTNQPLQLLNTLTLDRGGVMWVSNSAVTIDGTSGGILNAPAGTLYVKDGIFDCSSTTAAKVGVTSGATAKVVLDGGAMDFFQVQAGAGKGARGMLTISNGLLNSASLITLGQTLNSTGILAISGGQLRATNDLTKVGNLGVGQITMESGSAQLAFLSMGENAGASGTVLLSGGELRVLPRSTNDLLRVGSLGNGELTVSGGTHIIGSEFHLADDLLATGIVSITGGALIVTNDITAIGRYGFGKMSVTGGLVQLTNSSIGRHDGAVGILEVYTNGTLMQVDDMSIGRFSNSVGRVLLAGGLLALTNDNVWAGREGRGDLVVSNGVFSARALLVGVSPDGVAAPSGTAGFYGGTSMLSSNLIIGTTGLSTGQVVMAGGTLVIASTNGTGYLDVRSGAWTMGGGTVRCDELRVTNAAGQFAFLGGFVQAGSITISNGSPFMIGDGTSPAVLELTGGTSIFADGLVISSNSTVRGCGAIVGNVVNNGTLAICAVEAPSIVQTLKTGSVTTVFFNSVSGVSYTLEYRDTMEAPWTPIQPEVPGTGNVISQVDTNASVPMRFYRVIAK